MPVYEFDRVEDECLDHGDGGSEPQYLTSDGHGRPNGICLFHLEGEFVEEVGVGVELRCVNRGQVLAVVLRQSAELGEGIVTFSLPGVWPRRVMRDVIIFSNDVINPILFITKSMPKCNIIA